MTVDLAKKWENLESEAGSAVRMQRAVPDKAAPIYLLFDPASRRRGFRVILPDNCATIVTPRWREVTIVQPDPSEESSIILWLQDSQFETVFDAVIGDVIATLRLQKHSEWPASLAHRIEVWSRFFQERGFEGLGSEQQRGLYGELYTLLHHVIPRLPEVQAIEAWVGPFRKPQDFCLPSGFVEVKTLAHGRPRVVRINGVEQLAADGPLSLHVLVTREGAPGESLPALVGAVRAAMASSDAALLAFEVRLLTAGYLDVHAGQYRQVRRVAVEQTYEVCDDFPRVAAAPKGVSKVTYQLDLTACAGFQIELDAALPAMVDAS